jgi:hypothetical protein
MQVLRKTAYPGNWQSFQRLLITKDAKTRRRLPYFPSKMQIITVSHTQDDGATGGR